MGVNIKPPKNFAIKAESASEWKQWLKQFEWYAAAIELKKRTPVAQAATFMAVAGPEVAAVLETLSVSDENQSKIDELKKAFNAYYVPQINVTYERYVFNSIHQKQGEPFEDFLLQVKTQAKRCEFGTLNDSLVRDKIVFGVVAEKFGKSYSRKLT